ncbi:hypothetical protein CLV92_1098 [Kineococcus xinjiangensis]|uniref:Uncharacterized protein n=1 Tax=Kineococcus xinjiangensis TaxID=512762 RepID=A0A2S6IHN8_9ACTN|nr:hypothetical protein [Kineococcus xinjiangensis]PPK93732.1 hypothetical protein CLV92_1098 [Kineococcus xinjiangensis]
MSKNTRPANHRPGSPRRRNTASAHLGNRALLALATPFTAWLAEHTTSEGDSPLGPGDVLTVLAESMDWLLKRTRTTQVGPQTATRWSAHDLDLLLGELDSPVLSAFGRQQGWDEEELMSAVADTWELFLLFLEDTRRWTGSPEDLEECFGALDDASADEVALEAAESVSDEEEDAALAALPLTAQLSALLDEPTAAPSDVLDVMRELDLVEVDDDGVRPGPAARTWRAGTPEEVRELRRDALTVWVLEQLPAVDEEDASDAVPALLVAVVTSGMVGDPVEPGALADLLPEGEAEDGTDPGAVLPTVTSLLDRLTAAGVLVVDGGYVPPRGLWPALANVVVALMGDDSDHDHEGCDHDH